MNAIEQNFASAVLRLSTLGNFRVDINPDLKGEGGAPPNKSICFYADVPDLKGGDDIEFAVEIVNYPVEKLIYWVNTDEVGEEEFAEVLESAMGEGE